MDDETMRTNDQALIDFKRDFRKVRDLLMDMGVPCGPTSEELVEAVARLADKQKTPAGFNLVELSPEQTRTVLEGLFHIGRRDSIVDALVRRFAALVGTEEG